MGEQKLIAGASIDVLTAHELKDVLKNWAYELTRGLKFVRRSMSADVDANGLLAIGSRHSTIAPPEGFVWSLTRISVSGLTGSELLSLHVNDVSPSQFVAQLGAELDSALMFGDHGCVLNYGDSLLASGAGLTTGAAVTVTAQIKEAPALLAWSL